MDDGKFKPYGAVYRATVGPLDKAVISLIDRAPLQNLDRKTLRCGCKLDITPRIRAGHESYRWLR
jgi:hypothetical protein